MISLITTVLNEGASIEPLMQSILAQTRLPQEIIIVDGGSDDDTVARIEQYADRLPLRVLVRPGCNISEGRNYAIAEAHCEIIACTDAGVRLAENWLEELTRPLIEDRKIGVAAGFFQADPHNVFETAMGATVLPLQNEIQSDQFLPSSRSVAFRKQAVVEIGGYPDWLDYCEDLVFDLRLRLNNVRFVFVPEAVVYFRPRTSLPAYYKQYYRYARGDGKADLWRKRHMIRYVTYLILVPAIAALGLRNRAFWLLYGLGGAVYLRRPYQRLPEVMQDFAESRNKRLLPHVWLWAIALVPVIRVLGDIAKMFGYPVGLWWRRRNHPPQWRFIDPRKS